MNDNMREKEKRKGERDKIDREQRKQKYIKNYKYFILNEFSMFLFCML